MATLRASIAKADERALKPERLAAKLDDDLRVKTSEIAELNRG